MVVPNFYSCYLFILYNQNKFLKQQILSLIVQTQIQFTPFSRMQQLCISVKERINKIRAVVKDDFVCEDFRSLREEEKNRCEKQSFIISMLRSNKVVSPQLKKAYFSHSLELMHQIEPKFKHKQQVQITEDNFLNDFVGLFTSFFEHFQGKLTFKTRIKNFLRPTNQNLVIDLVKYLVDFTRDYYAQTLFWKTKSNKKQEKHLVNQIDIAQKVQKIKVPQKQLKSFSRNFTNANQTRQNPQSSLRSKTDQQERRPQQNNYDIMDINPLPQIKSLNKDSGLNCQPIKMRINQLFRQQKSRNSAIKAIFQSYCDEYKTKFCEKNTKILQYPFYETIIRNDPINISSYPFKFQLMVQKNGFSLINVDYDIKRFKSNYQITNNLKFASTSNIYVNNNESNTSNKEYTSTFVSPIRNAQILTQNSQFTPKKDYILSSMKILRVSDSFLPTLMNQPKNPEKQLSNLLESPTLHSQSEAKNQDKTNTKSFLPFALKSRKLIEQAEQRPASQAKPEKQIQRQQITLKRVIAIKRGNTQNKSIYDYSNNKQQQYYHRNQTTKNKKHKIKNQTMNLKQSQIKMPSSKKRFFPAKQQKAAYQMDNYMSKNGKAQRQKIQQNSQQKILEWLQKIKNLKQLERRKILGMNY